MATAQSNQQYLDQYHQNQDGYQQQYQKLNEKAAQQVQTEGYNPYQRTSNSGSVPNNQYKPTGENFSQNYSNTQQTDGRRKHPHDIKGRKKEWLGLEHHKKEVDHELHRNETDIRNIKQQHLLTELDKKLLAQLEEKRQQLLLKSMENNEMIHQMQVYNQQLLKNKEDKKLLQQGIADSYEQQRINQSIRDGQYRAQKLDWEQRLIQYNQERVQSEEVRKREQKEYIKDEKSQDLQRAGWRHDLERQKHLMSKEEYNKLCSIYEEKENNKEKNYRQFYKDVAVNQTLLQEQHHDAVLKPLLARQAHLEDIINRNANEYQIRRAKQELGQIIRRKNELLDTKDHHQLDIGQKVHLKEVEKIEKKEKVKERLEDLANYNQWLEWKQQEKVQKQKQLKDFLEKQLEEKTEMDRQAERMTKIEKKHNELDLQAFKSMDSGLYSMIPGWNPQIGQLPPRQNREQLQRDIMDALKKPANRQQTIEASYTSGVQGLSNSSLQQNGQRSLLTSSVPNLNQYQKIGEPDSHFAGSPVVQAHQTVQRPYKQEQVYEYGHNPITNPMPYNIQNKYIAREFMNASQGRQNILSNIGANAVVPQNQISNMASPNHLPGNNNNIRLNQ